MSLKNILHAQTSRQLEKSMQRRDAKNVRVNLQPGDYRTRALRGINLVGRANMPTGVVVSSDDDGIIIMGPACIEHGPLRVFHAKDVPSAVESAS